MTEPAVLPVAERRALRAAAHALRVVVTVGSNGVTPALLRELDLALETHELLKVRVNADDRAAREALVAELCQGSGAALVQRTGHVATVWRQRRPAEPKPKPGVERGRKREGRKQQALKARAPAKTDSATAPAKRAAASRTRPTQSRTRPRRPAR